MTDPITIEFSGGSLVGPAPDHEVDVENKRIRWRQSDGSWGEWLTAPAGPSGPKPTILPGTVSTLAPGSPATVTVTGDAPDFMLHFGIPQGATGLTGPAGTFGMMKAPPALAYVNATTITIAAGTCRDELDAVTLVNPAPFNIALAGGPASAHRHVLFGYNGSGNPAAVFSTTNALPAGWQAYRRIGSIRTDASGNILQFVQSGDRFILAAPVLDANYVNTAPTSATLISLTVPLDVAATALLSVQNYRSGGSPAVDVWCPLVASDRTVANPGGNPTPGTSSVAGAIATNGTTTAAVVVGADVDTNLAGQVYIKALGATASLGLWTRGWIDRRGRDK
ncbi:hypothetical protein [Microvirga solisilvae]|uniref:hypothetical protein n=1 Tax=Microvirga solisilvae TaxID=2919498 RepID=UPI001FB046A3|nr:hypothetical protein [Microvirga solisilvae]